MSYEKLKRLAILIGVIIVLILTISNCEWGGEDKSQNDFDEEVDISTETPFDISSVEDERAVRDYANPTIEEEMEVYELYGLENCYFDEKGLHIKKDDGSETIRTQLVLDDYEFIKNISLPDEKKLEYYEYEDEIFRISLVDVSLKELEKYLKEFEDEYQYPATIIERFAIYKAYSSEGHMLTVYHDPAVKRATLVFKISTIEE